MINISKHEELKALCHRLLEVIGEDPARPGLINTPARFADFWAEFIDYADNNTNTTFESVTVDQLIVVSGIRVWSLCEHHLLPFWCDVTIGYLPKEKVLGLSKFARIAHKHAHKLQLQEKLVHQIAEELQETTDTLDVAVSAAGVHTCMIMRGIKTDGLVRSSVLYGKFRDDHALRDEFFHLSRDGRPR